MALGKREGASYSSEGHFARPGHEKRSTFSTIMARSKRNPGQFADSLGRAWSREPPLYSMFPVAPRLHVTPILFSSLHSYLSQFNLSRSSRYRRRLPVEGGNPRDRKAPSSTRVNNTPADHVGPSPRPPCYLTPHGRCSSPGEWYFCNEHRRRAHTWNRISSPSASRDSIRLALFPSRKTPFYSFVFGPSRMGYFGPPCTRGTSRRLTCAKNNVSRGKQLATILSFPHHRALIAQLSSCTWSRESLLPL